MFGKDGATVRIIKQVLMVSPVCKRARDARCQRHDAFQADVTAGCTDEDLKLTCLGGPGVLASIEIPEGFAVECERDRFRLLGLSSTFSKALSSFSGRANVDFTSRT